MQKKQKHRKRQKNYILYNLIYFIGGTAKLHTDDIVNKSVVFRITETSYHIIHFSKNRENFNNSKVLESNWKGDYRVSRKNIYELCTNLHPFAEETESSKKPNVSRDSSGVLYYCRRPHKKTTNAFSISRPSVSPVIKQSNNRL